MLPGLDANDRILTNIEILCLKEIPKSMVIVGAGAVGVEFASIYPFLRLRSHHRRNAAPSRSRRG